MNWTLALGGSLALIGSIVFVALAWTGSATFLGLHVFSRTLIDSAHHWTYASLGGGIKIVKLYSLGINALLVAYLWHKRKLEIGPFGLIALAMVFAATAGTVLSGRWDGFANVALRWIYVWLLACLAFHAVRESTPQRVAAVLLICLMYPMANIAIAGALFGPKFTADQFSYVGTFGHESHVSYVLFAEIAFAIGLISSARSVLARGLLIGLAAAGHVLLYMTNYRTALVALAVFWLVMLVYYYPRLGPVARIQVTVFGGILVCAMAFQFGPTVVTRLADLGTLVSDPARYFDFSTHSAIRDEDDELMSGRVSLINRYMYYYVHAPIEQRIAGLGPEAGTELTGKYAHNEFVGTLVEQGVIGIVTLLCVLYALFAIARAAARRGDWMARSMTGLVAAICTMSLGTMPFRDARSLMYLGIALGFIEFYRRAYVPSKAGYERVGPAADDAASESEIAARGRASAP